MWSVMRSAKHSLEILWDEGTTRKGWKDTGHFKECKSCPILSHPFILIIPNLSDRSLTQDMKQSRQNSFSSK